MLASVTVRLADDLDVAAVAFASRRADERWFVWEQPDRDGFAIAALGAAVTVDAVPAQDRFAQAAPARWVERTTTRARWTHPGRS